MAEIGPKEAAQRANGAATRAGKAERKLIPYAGKPRGEREAKYGVKPSNTKPPRKRRKWTRKT